MPLLITLLLLSVYAVSVQAQPAYDYDHIQCEHLGRGFIVVRDEQSDSLFFSWRLLRQDEAVSFNVLYRGNRLNDNPLSTTTFFKTLIPQQRQFQVSDFELEILHAGQDVGQAIHQSCVALSTSTDYLSIPLRKPAGGQTPDGRGYDYVANDASVGDVDGDGEYELILKWEPTNARDNSHEGYTGPVLIDCYRLTSHQTSSVESSGHFLWRINLGHNIRAGAHYTQFMVYDLDGDGRAEVVMKTADGTRDGIGQCIGDSLADYRMHTGRTRGRILDGPEYLTVFEGLTGKQLCTVGYVPPRGNVSAWGDAYGNRVDRYLACIAYLDGIHPSVVACRGYYTRTVLAAWDWDGKSLCRRWVFDTDDVRWHKYAGQGNHNLRVADVDADGCDEIVYGAMTVDHDGQGLYTTRMGHGDAIHLMPFYPDSTTLQVWNVHENRVDGSELHDARTGRVIFQLPSTTDVGRGMAADIDPTNPGVEMWSSDSRGILNVRGEVVASQVRIPINSAVWWDGDLLREMLDREQVSKYDWMAQRCNVIKDFRPECRFNNGTKSNPCLSADIVGDWREEVIVRTADSQELRIYTTTIPTPHRLPCLMTDIPYRLSVATQNVGYNQPPEPGFYLGADFIF